MRTVLPLALALSACSPEPVPQGAALPPGDLVARYVDDAVHVALGGRLETNGIAFEPCEAPTIQAGPAVFEFVGDAGAVDVDLPDAELCGIRIVVTRLQIDAEHDGVPKTVIGQDFDFWVPGEAIPTDGGLVLQLGSDTWLADVLPLAPEGTTLLNSETPEDLLVAFYDGLHQGSSLDAQDTIVEQP